MPKRLITIILALLLSAPPVHAEPAVYGTRAATLIFLSGDAQATGQNAPPQERDLTPVMLGGKWGFTDETGTLIIEPQYGDFMLSGAANTVFHEGLAAVMQNGRWGYIDMTGETVVPFTWDYADVFSGGYAVVGKDGKYGYIDRTGKLVIDTQFDDANLFFEGAALVGADGCYWLTDPAGGRLSSAVWFFDATFTDTDIPGLIQYQSDGKWSFAEIVTSSDPLESAGPWARGDISEALSKGFVPPELQEYYAQPVTRGEFVHLAMSWLVMRTGKDADTLLAERGCERGRFTDTDDPVILAGAALGITNGVGGGRFGVDQPFAREQAATMLCRTLEILGVNTQNALPYGFSDIGKADTWAVGPINYAAQNGIMSGISSTEKLFDPKGDFTREQSIIVFNRLTR